VKGSSSRLLYGYTVYYAHPAKGSSTGQNRLVVAQKPKKSPPKRAFCLILY
jgi:hypothetical protein